MFSLITHRSSLLWFLADLPDAGRRTLRAALHFFDLQLFAGLPVQQSLDHTAEGPADVTLGLFARAQRARLGDVSDLVAAIFQGEAHVGHQPPIAVLHRLQAL